MIRLLSHPLTPFPPVKKLSLFLSLPVCHLSSLLTGVEGRGWGGRGALSYDRKKAWPSIYRSILSVLFCTLCLVYLRQIVFLSTLPPYSNSLAISRLHINQQGQFTPMKGPKDILPVGTKYTKYLFLFLHEGLASLQEKPLALQREYLAIQNF